MITKGMHEILHTRSAVVQRSVARPRIPRIFNHDILSCTAEGVKGNHLYSGRILGATEHDDIVQLHPLLKSEWSKIVEHYTHIGLEHSHNIIWDIGLEYMPIHDGITHSLFFYGDQELKRSGDIAWAKTVEFINSKNNFMSLADELAVPVPKTRCFNSVEEISITDIKGFPYPCYLKAAISVSGVGIYRCENSEELQRAMMQFDSDVPVQLQQEVKTDTFLNMQYQIVDGVCRRLLATEQILDGTAHQGNVYPTQYEPWNIIEPMAEWMAERGFKDILAFDVAIQHGNNEVKSLAIECNPRYNGASYPTLIAMKLDINEWESCNFSTRHNSLENLDLSGIEYNSTTGEGVVIVNWGPILVGKIMLMIAGDGEVRQRIRLELQERLW
ncbi:MAG: ATP-grasp domain-containing protein [Candidatus Thiodiazotropha sp. DIVDIV]